MSSPWTAEKIRTLKVLWAVGESCSRIGKRMGFTRNAIIGKVHRLKLSSRKSPIIRHTIGDLGEINDMQRFK